MAIKDGLAPSGTRRRQSGRLGLLNFAFFLLVLAIGIARVTLTYALLSNTTDEPMHIASGVQYLNTGRYSYEIGNPPLAQLAIAAGPDWLTLRPKAACRIWVEDDLAQCAEPDYWRILIAARLGCLPFFSIMLFLTWLWGTRIARPLWSHGRSAPRLHGPRCSAMRVSPPAISRAPRSSSSHSLRF